MVSPYLTVHPHNKHQKATSSVLIQSHSKESDEKIMALHGPQLSL